MDLFKDFQTVKDLKFDIKKLQIALKQVLSRKDFDDAAGTKYIASIALNQIPGDPDSTKGESAKGIYWTKPDSSGKESVRARSIDESNYTEFVQDLDEIPYLRYDLIDEGFKTMGQKTNRTYCNSRHYTICSQFT